MRTQDILEWQVFEEDDEKAQELCARQNPAQNFSPDTNKPALKPQQWSAFAGASWPALFIGLAVAARMDAVYAALQRDLGLPYLQPQDKLKVELLAEPGYHVYPETWRFKNNSLRVPFPAHLQIPTELTDADALSDIITHALTYHFSPAPAAAPVPLAGLVCQTLR